MSAQFKISLRHVQDYQFLVEFDESLPSLLTDEPDPIGAGAGPCPEQMPATSVAKRLGGSLVFALGPCRQKDWDEGQFLASSK
ncbi:MULTISPECIES: hypothetical protein [unclassified Methylobacterium]|uniref:hypothetical protein n=1 Tax=unclassified Methylobacterium TaxID=2615210 RepID=UPI000152D444|nr:MULTISPECIES: hypothetical protein [Methylobacterium]WFT79090.1 hypothetical protein QA634_28255 [Methylobacterium nodulans]